MWGMQSRMLRWVTPRGEIFEVGNYITKCVFVASEEKLYFHTAESDSDEVCGVYLFTDPDKIIEIRFQSLNVPCKSGGLVTFFDGWELNGQFFPGTGGDQGQLEERYHEFCGIEKPEKAFITSQNAGMLQYRVPKEGTGFSFYVKFYKSPMPCNILVESREGVYTLRNHGRNKNCTLIAIFPARVEVLSLQIGIPNSTLETGIMHQCGYKTKQDELQIGGSEGLDTSDFISFRGYCGLDSSPDAEEMVVSCGVTVVRLLSSGHYDNSATFSIGEPNEYQMMESPFTCLI